MPEPEIQLPAGCPRLSVDDLHRLMRQQGLDLAMAQAWVLDEVARAIELPKAEEEALLKAYLVEEGLENEAVAQEWMQRRGLSNADLLVQATQEQRLALFRKCCFADEVEIRFLERKADLDHVVYSIVRVRDEAIAEEVYQRIREGEADFAELAEAFSEGMERETRGQMGPLPLSIAHEELVRRLRVSQPGQLWAPFFVVDIWVVLRFERLIPAALNGELREQMLQELYQAWFDERVRQLLAGEDLPALPFHRLGYR